MQHNNDYLEELLYSENIDWNQVMEEEESMKEEYQVMGDVWGNIEFEPDEFIMDPEEYAYMRLHEARLYSGYYEREENQNEND